MGLLGVSAVLSDTRKRLSIFVDKQKSTCYDPVVDINQFCGEDDYYVAVLGSWFLVR